MTEVRNSVPPPAQPVASSASGSSTMVGVVGRQLYELLASNRLLVRPGSFATQLDEANLQYNIESTEGGKRSFLRAPCWLQLHPLQRQHALRRAAPHRRRRHPLGCNPRCWPRPRLQALQVVQTVGRDRCRTGTQVWLKAHESRQSHHPPCSTRLLLRRLTWAEPPIRSRV